MTKSTHIEGFPTVAHLEVHRRISYGSLSSGNCLTIPQEMN